MKLLVATQSEVLSVDAERGTMHPTTGLADRRPTCLAVDPRHPDRAWCGTDGDGVFRSDDRGASWRPSGLAGRRVMSLTASPAGSGAVWAGTEPSEVWRAEGGDDAWERTEALHRLASSSEWAFPPKPETHHVRWIACHPRDPGRLWVAVEAGALVSTLDGGRSWHDRMPGGPYDTHELALHVDAPDRLRAAAGDGYFESADGGATWRSPRAGLDAGYLRSVAIDPGSPDVVVVSAATHARAAYVAGRSDGRLYRRVADGPWERVSVGWPDPPATIAPLLRSARVAGELWAADERGIHRSRDGGVEWRRSAAFPTPPRHLRGLAPLG